jgi:menaquinone-dependent protoporphyrinogen oxidase
LGGGRGWTTLVLRPAALRPWRLAMKILVTYATRHGATAGIAERIANRLAGRGLDVTLRTVDDAPDPTAYDGVVIGSAAYAFHWLHDASAYVRHHRAQLASRPVWLFSSGPLGTDTVDAKGRDVLATSEPKEFAEFRSLIGPRGLEVFYGAFDPDAAPVGLMEKVMHVLPAAREALPRGDFRDWERVDAWSTTIADALLGTPVAALATP